MNPQEEEQYEIQQRIEQEQPPSNGKQILIGIVGLIVLLGLPVMLEAASGHKPWRF